MDDTVERPHPQEAQNHLGHALASSIKQQHFPRGLVTVSCKLRGGDSCPWEPAGGKKWASTGSGAAEMGIQTQQSQAHAPASGSLAWPLTCYVTLGKAPISFTW